MLNTSNKNGIFPSCLKRYVVEPVPIQLP